jgi:hypothetical protein
MLAWSGRCAPVPRGVKTRDRRTVHPGARTGPSPPMLYLSEATRKTLEANLVPLLCELSRLPNHTEGG